MAAGRTTLSKTDVVACMTLFQEEVLRLVRDGRYVHTPLASFFLMAHGSMADGHTRFTPGAAGSNHKLKVGMRVVHAFERAATRGAVVKRSEPIDRATPVVHRAVSVRDDTVNGGAPGDFLSIRGCGLKLDPSNPDEGVFFVNGTERRAAQYAHVSAKKLVIDIPPALKPGAYALVVRSGAGTWTVKEGRLHEEFVVSAS